MKKPSVLLLAACLVDVSIVVSTAPQFQPIIPGQQWVRVGYLNMSEPAQQCPIPWSRIDSPIASCGKKNTTQYCDSLQVPTAGVKYQQVCGRFRGYQVGRPDAFCEGGGLEKYYVDGISITYGSPGKRRHVHTYAVGKYERYDGASCPCAGGMDPPSFLTGSDYYCESGVGVRHSEPMEGVFYSSDVLWDGEQCGIFEVMCCSPPTLPWFCKTFPTPISEDLEIRICTDETVENENVALEFFELYILGKFKYSLSTMHKKMRPRCSIMLNNVSQIQNVSFLKLCAWRIWWVNVLILSCI